jgi:subtilisin family serine protease
MKIHRAWFESNRGDGITIGMIDTGVSLSQAKLNEEFSGGFSGSRTVERYGFHEPCYLFFFCENDGDDDLCGHGTNMAGTAVGPASADGSFAGVAFRSNLVGIRATEDVIHNTSAEKNGVSDAYTYLGNRSDVEIISMSLGDLFSSGQITDAINYAYNQGKLIFNAAGTSLSFTTFVGVIFPANLSNTVAVTGIKTGSPMAKCTTCHSGPQVDFAITMEDQNDPDRTPLTLSLTGNNPDYTGGSSVATATAAGIAALVWSNDPDQSREEVMEALKASGSFYPARDDEFGWGKINARTAVLY